ncbi:transcriptional regulator family: Fungal Specific TF [Penicillium hordei]|uniref:Transcriptional regulator family: Fungal Specific TF n=1 Tax=Penicillium hordei TaxID=40994 RepID=A0AAD6DZS8_9EURO|nr:transcriptional regulator family: Fungal Specific TF [Penicillium hordei]KAJ5598043.1 transcriptional regulator family: Fungal Specific TF [Penicillium hordei]
MISEFIPETVVPVQLLRYIPVHRVLICLHCRYAIQPGAIVRHLKEIHHLKRLRRRAFVEYASQFELADIGSIILPDETQFPVDSLPILDGLACRFEGCGHLCATIQRMKAHWSSVHHLSPRNGGNWCSVPLQTFFRGNALRYFTNPALLASLTDSSEEPMSASEVSSITTVTTPNSGEGQGLSSLVAYENNISLSVEDMHLFDHYLNHTYKTISCGPETDGLFRIIVPQIAARFPFLLHGMLACSALHLASSNPPNQRSYTLQAIQHQDRALPAFHLATMHVDSNNCQAILAYAFFLVVYGLSSESEDETLFLSNNEQRSSSLNWISLLRNGCSMLCDVWSELKQGPLAPFAALWRDDIGVTADPNDPLLVSLLSAISESSEAVPSVQRYSDSDVYIYRDAASKLAEAFEFTRRFGASLSVWDALNSWLTQVLPEYFDLLDQNHSGALLLLAHYAILLKPLQAEWFLNGWVTKLMDGIGRRLEGNCSLQIWKLFLIARREFVS